MDDYVLYQGQTLTSAINCVLKESWRGPVPAQIKSDELPLYVCEMLPESHVGVHSDVV